MGFDSYALLVGKRKYKTLKEQIENMEKSLKNLKKHLKKGIIEVVG